MQLASEPVPNVSEEAVIRVVSRDFSDADVSKILNILNGLVVVGTERTMARVKLAVLKLSNGDMDALKSFIKEANDDFRDVIGTAEYPNYPWYGSQLSEREQQRIINEDSKQYEKWLYKM